MRFNRHSLRLFLLAAAGPLLVTPGFAQGPLDTYADDGEEGTAYEGTSTANEALDGATPGEYTGALDTTGGYGYDTGTLGGSPAEETTGAFSGYDDTYGAGNYDATGTGGFDQTPTYQTEVFGDTQGTATEGGGDDYEAVTAFDTFQETEAANTEKKTGGDGGETSPEATATEATLYAPGDTEALGTEQTATADPSNAEALVDEIESTPPVTDDLEGTGATTEATGTATATGGYDTATGAYGTATEATGTATYAPEGTSGAEGTAYESTATEQTAGVEAPPLPPPNEFGGAPPVPGTARIMAEGEAPEKFRVRRGDTLFDICDQLLDEPDYWPKLWALNPDIKNPHFIYPGMELRFYPGDDKTPPYLEVVEEADLVPVDKSGLQEQELISEEVKFPEEEPQTRTATPVVGSNELSEPADLYDKFLDGGGRFQATQIPVQVPGFIYRNQKQPLGTVLGGQNGQSSLGPGQKGLVQPAGGGNLSAGTTYTVLRPSGEVYNPETEAFVGYQYYYVASMTVEKALKPSLQVARVRSSRLGVKPGDMLVNYISVKRTVPTVSAGGGVAAAEANIVAFEHARKVFGGEGHFAFIDRGSGDGISPGMYLPVFQAPHHLTSELSGWETGQDYGNVGLMRIIDTTDVGAVGYIVRNNKELRLGDPVGRL